MLISLTAWCRRRRQAPPVLPAVPLPRPPLPPLPVPRPRPPVPAGLRETRAQSQLVRPYVLPAPAFRSAEEAVAWVRAQYAAADPVMAPLLSPGGLLRRVARHADREQVSAARRVLQRAGIV